MNPCGTGKEARLIWTRVAVATTICIALALLLVLGPRLVRGATRNALGLGLVADPPGQSRYLGLIRGGRFHLMDPTPLPGSTLRLTGIQMQEARSPESAELDLRALEGRVVVIQGRDGGGWLYSARVVTVVGNLAAQFLGLVY